MNEFTTHEHAVAQKIEGKWLVARIGLVFLYVALATVILLCGIGTRIFVPLLALTPVFICIVIFITWRYTCVEYEVIIEGGEISFTTIYGKGFRKRLFSLPVISFTEIGEYDDLAYEEISKLSLQKNLIIISSLSAPCVYYALYEDGKDQCILYFDAPKKAVELLKKINSGAFRASAKRMNTQKGVHI